MFRWYAYKTFVQLLNPKLRYVGNNNSFLLWMLSEDIYVLAIHNINLPWGSQEDK